MIDVGSVANVGLKTNYFLTPEQEQFVIYIRTKQVFSLRLRSEKDDMQPVHVSSAEIENRFFPYPQFNRRKELQDLVNKGELTISERGKRFVYEACKAGGIDLSLLVTKPLPNDLIYTVMLNNLKAVSLPSGAPSTEYFDLFLKYKNTRPQLFFKVDQFAGRVHSPVSNFHRTHRPNLLLNNEKTASLDVATMQPLLLGKILTKDLVNNEYSQWISQGKDIYLELQRKAGLKTRDEAKKAFFEILFSKPSDSLAKLFGKADWINWINEYKSKPQSANPHGIEKPHSNLAWLLQTTEVKVMSKIWRKLIAEKIVFIPVHDEIIVPVSHSEHARTIMSEVLSLEFDYFRISGDKTEKKDVFEATLSTSPTFSEAMELIPPEILRLHAEYELAERDGLLAHHTDREYIRTLWQAVLMYAHRPDIQSLYTDSLTAIMSEMEHNTMNKSNSLKSA